MQLTLKKVSGDRVYLSVAGICRDSLASPEPNPLSQIPLENIFQQRVLVNLAEVTMLNSSGIGWLLNCHKHCREAGGQWIVHSIPVAAMKILRMMRLHEVLELAGDEQEATAAVSAGETSA